MTIQEQLKERIRQERQRRARFTDLDLLASIQAGRVQEAIEQLIFFTPPAQFGASLAWLRPALNARLATANANERERTLRFAAELALALASFLPRWNLQDGYWGNGALSDAEIAAAAAAVRAWATTLAAAAPAAATDLLAAWRREAAARLKAEGVADPAAAAQELVGEAVHDYLDRLSAQVARSSLRRIAEMRRNGRTRSEISNDYAAFLPYTLYLGASFVTCNPTLVDIAWAIDPDLWTPTVDAIIAAHPQADAATLARLVTLEIVFANMRLLRPIFLLTEGEMGCVSLQVNPQKHGDAPTMIADALAIYEELQARLDGGVPNVVFKLPATRAGLEACRALTARGIGVTITVNFGLFQHLRFAEAIAEGHAIFSTLAHMSGRLAFPVRDELLGKLDALAAHGIDEARARMAAAWSGVAVLKRLYALMAARGYDFKRIRPLIASLRIYEGPLHAGLPSPFPDITEVVGTPIITVFPNVRRAFDRADGIALTPTRIEEPVPPDVLDVLVHSEIFKQAYYVADRAWAPAEEERFRPAYPLALEDEDAVAEWPPVRATLAEFSKSYDSLVQRILARQQALQ